MEHFFLLRWAKGAGFSQHGEEKTLGNFTAAFQSLKGTYEKEKSDF